MTETDTISVVIESYVATITINRPEARNALNKATIHQLTAAFASLHSNSSVRCVLLRGSGMESFCAGADLRELLDDPSPHARREFFTAVATLISTIQQCPHPVVCLVYGFALAGGLGLVAASDIVFAADDSLFGLPEVAVGLAPFVVTAPLTKRIGARGLAYLAISGERISASEAHRIGLVTRVVDKDSALTETLNLCATISQRGPAAVQATKLALKDTQNDPTESFIFELADRSALVSLSDEASEGIKAFSEKRAPSWKHQ